MKEPTADSGNQTAGDDSDHPRSTSHEQTAMTTTPSFDCTDIKAVLSGLIDDQVDTETRYLAERHLVQCADCRTLMSEAESLDELIVMDAAALSPARLPEGFMDGVLSRTVYARMYEHAGFSWTNWLGWVAAAACLCLAVTMFVLDRQSRSRMNMISSSDSIAAITPDAPVRHTADGSMLRSFTYDGPIQPTALRASNRMVIESESMLDEPTRRTIDEQLALAHPTRSALERVAQRPTISAADSDTLDAASRLLEMIAESDLTNFADIEFARRVAVYDELAERLADVRMRVKPADRATVLAAESIILRIVNGPLDMNDLRMLHDTVASLDLAAQLGAMTALRDFSTSM